MKRQTLPLYLSANHSRDTALNHYAQRENDVRGANSWTQEQWYMVAKLWHTLLGYDDKDIPKFEASATMKKLHVVIGSIRNVTLTIGTQCSAS